MNFYLINDPLTHINLLNIVMNRKYIVELSEEEKQRISRLLQKRHGQCSKVQAGCYFVKSDRCRYTTEQICEAVQVSSSTVFRVKRQFVEEESSGSFE